MSSSIKIYSVGETKEILKNLIDKHKPVEEWEEIRRLNSSDIRWKDWYKKYDYTNRLKIELEGINNKQSLALYCGQGCDALYNIIGMTKKGDLIVKYNTIIGP